LFSGGDVGSIRPLRMKAKKKKKSLLPRRTWKINPYTKVKPSDKIYSRRKAKKVVEKEV
jgi:hypothetical protein